MLKEYHFEATIIHCVSVEAENEVEARELALEEFNDGERLSEIIISKEDIKAEEKN